MGMLAQLGTVNGVTLSRTAHMVSAVRDRPMLFGNDWKGEEKGCTLEKGSSEAKDGQQPV